MGEFVRYHPAGKATIVKMGAKVKPVKQVNCASKASKLR
jgi:hypothetical protein